ncbi:molybdopterin biosynthesis protein MoeA [Sulfurimonas gotlandica GD1]|uniref:Molybdopterin molybdenumtransferase n=1 Tax=Sulfurimonas gotlandica (strain DSM 19862 / JCM 16533 / GD1) TaxID=929558 RepID=B6BHS7_SULGG|nr:gephyrin-like molybdotransferase Glp [Sulfurimonas gotlandica]EDZ63690.1 molybdopterin binding domain protein [Sulfurimonas gotlandica GD1]EHP30078.1 molybdopterin biosynthesis protein MoeA [Sulfurimonas gotlandica GD1]
MAVTILEALELIHKHTRKKSLKILPIEQALSSILAEDIIATHNLPPYDNSAMDGYAVKVADADNCVKVTHTIFAGDNSDEVLTSGNGIKIMTGAKIPDGCECIVPVEDTTECYNGVTLPNNLSDGRHIRLCGEDIKKGEPLLKSGQKLQAHQITLLASQGISHIKVYKRPHVALFASGSELKMHFENVEAYQLYNTNTPTLLSRAQELGCEVDFIGTAQDTLEDLKAHVKSALNSDLIITSGGVSVGDADFTKEAFGAFGMETYFDKVEIKPGKPTTFGRINNTLVLNLPGNPMAAALNFELFGQNIILALSGINEKFINPIETKMKNDYRLKKGRITLVPGSFDGSCFEPCKKFAPGMVSPLASSNSYIMVNEGVEFIASGDIVKVMPIRFCFTNEKEMNLVSC